MEILIAKNAGFCFGVDRAVKMTVDELNRDNKEIYSFGPLIHNPQAVESLEKKGLTTIDDYDSILSGRIIVRSHGVSKSVKDEITIKGLELIDCTCPYVIAVHKKVNEYSLKEYDIVIIGDKTHPEVIGINGWCDNKAYIVNSVDEAIALPDFEKVCVVSQTTNRIDKFSELSKLVEAKSKEVVLFNTICNATKLRQEAAEDLSKVVDAMIVLGGKTSSNTIKLAEISKNFCDIVYHVETIEEIDLQYLQGFNKIGITAGASTPDWIIKEAVKVMENYNKDEMMEAIDSSFKRIGRGDVLKGTVLYVTNTEVMVNINYKSDGIIVREELSKEPNVNPKDLFTVGDVIDVYVMKLDDGDGNVVLSAKRVNFIKDWEILETAFKDESVIEVFVDNAVKGGLTVSVNGVNGFMPASQISVNYVSDLNQYKGQTLKAKIIDFDLQKRRMILSRKVVEKTQFEKLRKSLWENIEVEKVLTGTVQRLTDFGAFVDLGGIDGLIHISDLAWYRVKHPSEVLKEGDVVEVKVLAFDKDKNRISLGLKQTTEEPWEVFLRDYKVSDVVEGQVVNLLDFGAFVRVIKGVDGLLHVSQISKDHIEKPSDILKVGDKIMVKITEINETDKKISLSAKDALETEEVVEESVTEDTPSEEKAVESVEVEAQEVEEESFDTSIEELTKED